MTKIEWATHTANWLAGCTRVSPACQHCYAETMSARLATMPHAPDRYRDGVVEGRRWTGRISYDPAALAAAFADLRRARHPRRVFINSMSDTFHADAPPDSLADLAAEVKRFQAFREDCADTTDWRIIMLLTKRPDRMVAWQRAHFPDGLPAWVWAGCTVEDQRRADERVSVLLRVETKGVRFLSVEPLLGRVCLPYSAFNGADSFGSMEGIGWVIVGCESGPGRRETDIAWVRDLRDQCTSAAVPFFLKQLYVDGQKVGLPELDGRTWAEVP